MLKKLSSYVKTTMYDEFTDLHSVEAKTNSGRICLSIFLIICLVIIIVIPGICLIIRGIQLVPRKGHYEWDNCTIISSSIKKINNSKTGKCIDELTYRLKVNILHPIPFGSYDWKYVKTHSCIDNESPLPLGTIIDCQINKITHNVVYLGDKETYNNYKKNIVIDWFGFIILYFLITVVMLACTIGYCIYYNINHNEMINVYQGLPTLD